jgi:HK97 family phage major capsid protein
LPETKIFGFFMPEQQFTREQILGKAQFRLITERAETVDSEKRIIKLSFSSDQPVEHWFGTVVLKHDEGCADLKRLNTAAPFLRNHDRHQRLGKVKRAWLENGKGYAEVQITRNEIGNNFWRDYEDDCLIGTSFGFLINSFNDALSDYKNDIYVTTDWTPFEITDESIPADTSVGVGRSLEDAQTISKTDAPQMVRESIKTENNEKMANENEIPAAPGTPEQTRVAAPAVQNPELTRTADFVAIGEAFGEVELARDYALMEGKTVADLKRAILEKRQASQTVVPPATVADVATRSGQRVELARSIPRYASIKNFKGEGAEERAYRFGQWFLAGPLGNQRAAQFCRDKGILLQRGQNESVNEKGGFLVPDEFGNDLIDLREQFGVFRRNAKIMPMASETRSDPRRTGGLTAYFDGESVAGTVSEKLWDRVGLTAKKIKVMARITSELNEDSLINTGDDLIGEIAYAFAEKEDRCGFLGDGSSTYGGIVGVNEKLKGLSGTIANISGLIVGSGNAYSELVLTDFEAVVALLPQYADTPMAKWFVHRSFYFNVMVKLMLAAGGVTAAEIEGQRTKSFLGYAVEFSQVQPKTEANSQVCAILGDLSKAARLGTRRDTTIAMSEHSRFSEDEIEIKGTERFDINVHDVGNATATAADKVAGPVVGLITAAS